MLDKKFDPATIEPKFRESWEKSGGFAANPQSNAEPYTIMMPPPNVTGSLHMGHALTFTLQDVLTRFNRMKGRDALWQPGTDHAGIAVQNIIEKQLDAEKVTRQEIGRPAFMERAWKWKAESGDTITNQLRHMGTSPDWDRERFTMDEGLSKAVGKVFVKLFKQGLIYKDERLVNWDPKLKTAISDLEVESKETNGHLWHFKYPIDGTDEFITVATTRPETMLGDTGVAVHPSDERYKHLVGKMVKLPLVGRLIPIVADEYPDPEAGTGAVKMTPAHDFNDFEVGKRQNLEIINVFDKEACINENGPEAYRGLERFEARKRVVADMDALGLLAEVKDHPHKVPHGDRSKQPIEPWLTVQWYVDAATLAKPALEAVESGATTFHPKQWENTYFAWLRNIQPWCISRQLWWGHQIPAWYGPDGTFFVEESEEQALKAAEAHYGQPTELSRDPDVLDTWFSSALWPFSTLGWPDKTLELERYYPTSTLVTGHDIIFFWVARMMMMGIHFMDEVPFKDVYIHALVLDEKGKKMSKSVGNVINPLEVIEEYGTDALRFTLTALSVAGRDLRMAKSRVEGYRNFATKIWNAARFAEMNEASAPADFDPRQNKLTLNRWIVSELSKAVQATDTALSTYSFNEAAEAAYQFVWNNFCDWYVEFAKPIFFGEDQDAISETRATMAWSLKQIVHMLHPIMPYITEELWHGMLQQANNFKADEMLLSSKWPELDASYRDEKASSELSWLIQFVTEIRSTRAELNVPAANKIPVFAVKASNETQAKITSNMALAQRLARLSDISFVDDTPEGAVTLILGDTTFALPLADMVDLDAEKQRLEKEADKIQAEIDKLGKTLDNPNFVSRAPKEVVEEQSQRREEFRAKLVKTVEAKARLEAL